MDAKEIGRYKVGDDEIVLRVPDPDDEVAVEKINAIAARMDSTEDAEMNVRYFAVLISVLASRPVEEIMTMVPLPTITQMVVDFREWTTHLRPLRPC